MSRLSTNSVTGAHYKVRRAVRASAARPAACGLTLGPAPQGGHDTLAKSSVTGELVKESVLKGEDPQVEGYDDDGGCSARAALLRAAGTGSRA